MKTKQDIIREGIGLISEKGFGLDWNSSVYLTDTIIEYLHDNDVVIKVDSPIVTATANTRVAFEGYSAYESLI